MLRLQNDKCIRFTRKCCVFLLHFGATVSLRKRKSVFSDKLRSTERNTGHLDLIRHFIQSCNLPAVVLTPERNAVAVPAESATWESVLYVLDKADQGNFSQLRKFSSPVSFLSCPSRIRAAVTVGMLIPSPRNKITFFAVFVLGFRFRFPLMRSTPSLNHLLLACELGTVTAAPGEWTDITS